MTNDHPHSPGLFIVNTWSLITQVMKFLDLRAPGLRIAFALSPPGTRLSGTKTADWMDGALLERMPERFHIKVNPKLLRVTASFIFLSKN
jgi:hypothetical protein